MVDTRIRFVRRDISGGLAGIGWPFGLIHQHSEERGSVVVGHPIKNG